MDTGLKKFDKLMIKKILAVILCLVSVGAMTVQVCTSAVTTVENELSGVNYEDAFKHGVLGAENDLWLYNSFEREFSDFYTMLGHEISAYGDGSEETFNSIKESIEAGKTGVTEKSKENLIEAASYGKIYFLSAIYDGVIESVGSLSETIDEGEDCYYYWDFGEYIDYEFISDENFGYYGSEEAIPGYVKEEFKDLDYDGIFCNRTGVTIYESDGESRVIGSYPSGYYAFKVNDAAFEKKVLSAMESDSFYSDYSEFYAAYKNSHKQIERQYPSARYFVRDNNGNTYTNIEALSSESTDEDIKKIFSEYGTYSCSGDEFTYFNNGGVYHSSFNNYISFGLGSYGYNEFSQSYAYATTTLVPETTRVVTTKEPVTTVVNIEMPTTPEPTTAKAVKNYVPSVVSASSYECYVGVDFSTDSEICRFASIPGKIDAAKAVIMECILICGILAVIAALCMIYLIATAGKRTGEEKICPAKTDKMFVEIRVAIDIALGTLAVFGILFILEPLIDSVMDKFILALIGILAAIVTGAFLDMILFLTRHIRNGTLINHFSFIWLGKKLYKRVKASSSIIKEKILCTKELKKTVFIRTAIVVGINIIVGSIAFLTAISHAPRAGLLLVLILFLFDLYVLYRGMCFVMGTEKLFNFVKEMRNGNLDISINKNILPEYLSLPAEDLQCLSEGMKEAVNEAVRQEKTKTELITNVSHDLKTPLTSIINYVDLMKKCDISDETALSYLQVLSEKSDRLKVLIEDLVEASKASAGALAVDFVCVSCRELVSQLLGEFEEEFEKKKLGVIVNVPENDVKIKADSKHIYRVLENLFVNVKKYALENTRVYITVSERDGKGIINIKNISAAPLNISADELKERFVRGEQSRTTEGNGLGLSIAENLCTLQKGSLNIEISGDLFSVTVETEIFR